MVRGAAYRLQGAGCWVYSVGEHLRVDGEGEGGKVEGMGKEGGVAFIIGKEGGYRRISFTLNPKPKTLNPRLQKNFFHPKP